MHITNDVPSGADRVGNEPLLFYHGQAIDGTQPPFTNCPLGSICVVVLSGSVTLYARIALANATADWKAMITAAGGTITGDLVVSDTLTAGDISVEA